MTSDNDKAEEYLASQGKSPGNIAAQWAIVEQADAWISDAIPHARAANIAATANDWARVDHHARHLAAMRSTLTAEMAGIIAERLLAQCAEFARLLELAEAQSGT